MSDCSICGRPNGFEDGGWLCLPPMPVDETDDRVYGCACVECTRGLVAMWTKEFIRKNKPTTPTTPTNSPVGEGTVYVEELRNVA